MGVCNQVDSGLYYFRRGAAMRKRLADWLTRWALRSVSRGMPLFIGKAAFAVANALDP